MPLQGFRANAIFGDGVLRDADLVLEIFGDIPICPQCLSNLDPIVTGFGPRSLTVIDAARGGAPSVITPQLINQGATSRGIITSL